MVCRSDELVILPNVCAMIGVYIGVYISLGLTLLTISVLVSPPMAPNPKSINVLDKEAFEDYAKLFVSQYDYIFYVNPIGTVMENNGVRETDNEFRKTIDFFIQRIADRYSHRMKNFVEISGTNKERVKKVKETIFS
jgi:hypothetical protein